MRRADAGEPVFDTLDFDQTPETNNGAENEERIEALTAIICRAGDEPEIKTAALLVLMATVEDSSHPKVVANAAKHFALTRCGELNICGTLDAQIDVAARELLRDAVRS